MNSQCDRGASSEALIDVDVSDYREEPNRIFFPKVSTNKSSKNSTTAGSDTLSQNDITASMTSASFSPQAAEETEPK